MLDWLFEATKVSLEAFGNDIKNYPLPTFLMLGITIYVVETFTNLSFLNSRGVIKWRPSEYSLGEKSLIAVAFIGWVFLSSVFGWVFNAFTEFLGWISGTGAVFVGPFAEHPLLYIAFLLGFSVLAEIYSLIAHLKLKSDALQILSICFLVLFATYVSTTFVSALRVHSEPASGATRSS